MTDDNGIRKPVMHSPDGVSLRDYVDRRFTECHAYRDRQEVAMDHRLTGMNEIRETMRDQAGDFLTRKEFEAKHEMLCSEIKTLREYADTAKGKASQNAVLFVAAISIAGLILGLVQLAITGK